MPSAAHLSRLRAAAARSRSDHALLTAPPAADARPVDPETRQPVGEAPSRRVLYDGPATVITERAAIDKATAGQALDADGLVDLPPLGPSAELELADLEVRVRFGPADARLTRTGRVARIEYGRTRTLLVLVGLTRAASV